MSSCASARSHRPAADDDRRADRLGLCGPHDARFTEFMKDPDSVIGYLREILAGREKRHIGHNPAAGAMVVALLLRIGGTAYTGWLMEEPGRIAAAPAIVAIARADAEEHGGGAGEAARERVKGIHETLANLSLPLVGLHVAGVALASRHHHEDLPLAW